jgi:hypothetical protein
VQAPKTKCPAPVEGAAWTLLDHVIPEREHASHAHHGTNPQGTPPAKFEPGTHEHLLEGFMANPLGTRLAVADIKISELRLAST